MKSVVGEGMLSLPAGVAGGTGARECGRIAYQGVELGGLRILTHPSGDVEAFWQFVGGCN